MEQAELTLHIGAVERETGLSKDTLRVWERRYGFPAPLRDANGERAYPMSQVEKLRLIKRLLDRGRRPGKIIPLRQEELAALGKAAEEPRERRQEIELFIRMIKAHQLPELRRMLPERTLIWAGGASVNRIRKAVDGVELIESLQTLLEKVRQWRTLHASI